jgi:hypothetical protein
MSPFGQSLNDRTSATGYTRRLKEANAGSGEAAWQPACGDGGAIVEAVDGVRSLLKLPAPHFWPF